MDFRSENKVKLEGGLSSMTDLVFLLLIFFIVISTLISSGVNIDLPKTSTTDSNEEPLKVNITEDNVYEIIYTKDKTEYVNSKSINKLEMKIKHGVKDPAKPVIILTGHPKSNWENTVIVIDIAKRNNIEIALKD